MLIRVDESEFNASPIGHYVRGRTFLVGYVEGLRILIVWGWPDLRDAEAASRLLEVALGENVTRPMQALTDISRLTGVDNETFALLQKFTIEQHARFESAFSKQAFVVSQGLNAAIAVGFYGLKAAAPCAFRVHPDLEQALSWLGRENPGRDAQGLISVIRAELSEIVQRLHQYLSANVVDADVDGAAKFVGIEKSTLHKHLRRAGTSFSEERAHARVRRAKQLLLEDKLKIDDIALAVGYSKRDQLSADFSAVVGMPPREWRERQRAATVQPDRHAS